MGKDRNLTDKPGFSYFITTSCEDWDALEYHQEWYAMKYEMNKSKVKMALTRQLEWFTSSGSQEEKSAASKMLKQLQNDSDPGGRIYDFWAGIFAGDKADFKRKVTDAKVREIQADKHLLMNKRSLDVLKETIVEHNETSVMLADFARAEQNARKRRKQYHQLDGFTTPSLIEEEKESSPRKHSFIESIDPNIESDLLEQQIPVQNHSKYPDQDSPDNIWLLPSGKPIDEVIRGPGNLHQSHPSMLGIIRIGSKIRKPEWIEQKDWNYLQTSIEYPNYKLTSNVENLVKELLETNSLMEYKQCVCKAKFKNEIDKEMEFVTDVFLWFTKNVFNPASAFHSKNKNEALLGSLMIHPMLQYLTNTTDRVIYVPGEIYLKASANQRLLRRNLKPDDDKPLGIKVDGSFHSPGEEGLEIGMVELSGGYLTSDLPRYLKDHVKGYWGCRDLLNDIVRKYNRSDYKIFRRLRSWFFHIHGLEVQIWGMDLPVSKSYRMFLVGALRLPTSWEDHHELANALRILRNLGRGLDDTLKILEELKKSHRRNSVLHSQSSILKSHIGDAKSSPKKPTGKDSRFINPLMYHDYNDSDYDDPPSPSPSGCSY